MQDSQSKKIIQLITDEQFEAASKMGLCIVRVSYNTDNAPINLSSKERLPDKEYIDYVQTLGIVVDHYDIRGITKD